VDGVPGNGHLTSGAYDQKSTNTVSPIPVSLPWAAVTISGVAANSAVVPSTSAQWAQFDGPDNPNTPRSVATSLGGISYAPSPGWYGTAGSPLQWTKSTYQNAQNPARVFMTYKPILFRYVTE
jgi:hypothetical protein